MRVLALVGLAAQLSRAASLGAERWVAPLRAMSEGHSAASLRSLRVVDLKEILRAKGLGVTGRKADLVARLLEALETAPEAVKVTPTPSPDAISKPLGAVSSKRKVDPEAEEVVKSVRKKVAKKPAVKEVVPRDATPRSENTHAGAMRRVLSWNVAGLRGLLSYEEKVAAFRELVAREAPDVLCLSEVKLQEKHVAEVEPQLLDGLGLEPAEWHVVFYCSTHEKKKGYSGVCMLARKASCGADVGASIRLGIGEPEADAEGRVITVDVHGVSVVVAYVPNAGMGLKRLDYRINTWEPHMRGYLKSLQRGGRPVVYLGDLNVAHADADFYNPEAKHMVKQAGTTPEERAAFGTMLEETGVVDLFRSFHAEAKGVFSYWSMRVGNRPFNRGLRLDYTVGSASLVDGSGGKPQVVDAFVLDGFGGSDHAPIGVDLVFPDL